MHSSVGHVQAEHVLLLLLKLLVNLLLPLLLPALLLLPLYFTAGSGKAELKRFPYINTFDANYHPELVGLLSQLGSWQMLQLRPQLTKLLAGTGVAVATPRNIGSATHDANLGHPDYEAPSAGARSGAGLITAAQQLSAWVAVAAAVAVLAL